jgi:predicted nucleotidyltransferase component of viral defense system
MTPITRQDILAHQAVVPWSARHQVEQDLLLCRTMVALFNDGFLAGQIAMRGGTLLHKVHLAPACRYSEDIDLVVVGARPEDHIRRAVRRVLGGVLGNSEGIGLGQPCAGVAEQCQTIPGLADDLFHSFTH